MVNKKIKQIIACALVLGATLGLGQNVVHAATNSPERAIVQSVETKASSYNDGLYEVENDTDYIKATESSNVNTGNSMARSALKSVTKYEVKDGKVKMRLSFNEGLFPMMQNITVTSDGKNLNGVVDKDTKSITFEVGSVDERLRVDMFIVAMGMNVSFYVDNKVDTVNLLNKAPILTGSNITTKVGEKIDLLKAVTATDKEDGTLNALVTSDTSTFLKDGVVTKDGVFVVTYKAVDKSGLESTKTIQVIAKEGDKISDGKYTIKNDIEYIGSGNAETGNTMARKTLKEISNVEVKAGKYFLTLNFDESQFKFIGEVKVKVDGNEVNVTIDKANATAKLEIPSIDATLEVSVLVTMMNRETTFKTTLLENTIVKVEEVVEPSTPEIKPEVQPATKPETKPETDSSNSTNNGAEQKVEIVKGKIYTIENNVQYKDNNPTGQAMARQYLESTSKIEEIDGKRYLSLTFTGVEYMSNHRFFINGQEVSYSTVSNDGVKATFRFAITSLDTKISVKMYVAPMGRDVEFDVTLDKDTLKFIKEYTAEKLPQTGGAMSSNLLLGLGSGLLGVAGIVKRKKKQ